MALYKYLSKIIEISDAFSSEDILVEMFLLKDISKSLKMCLKKIKRNIIVTSGYGDGDFVIKFFYQTYVRLFSICISVVSHGKKMKLIKSVLPLRMNEDRLTNLAILNKFAEVKAQKRNCNIIHYCFRTINIRMLPFTKKHMNVS